MYYFTCSKSIDDIENLKFYEMPSISVRESCCDTDISKKFYLSVWGDGIGGIGAIKDHLSINIHKDDINTNYSYACGTIRDIKEFKFKPITTVPVTMDKTILDKSGWNDTNCHIVRGWERLPINLLTKLLSNNNNNNNKFYIHIKDEFDKVKLSNNKNVIICLNCLESLIFSARNIRDFSDEAKECVTKIYEMLNGKINNDNISIEQLEEYINTIEYCINKKFIGYQFDDIEFARETEYNLNNIKSIFFNKYKKFYDLMVDSYYSCIVIMYDGDIPSNAFHAFHDPTSTVRYYNVIIKLLEPLIDIVEKILYIDDQLIELDKTNNVFHKDKELNEVYNAYLLSYHNDSVSRIGEDINIICNKFKDIVTSSGNKFIFHYEYKDIHNNLLETLNNYKNKYCLT